MNQKFLGVCSKYNIVDLQDNISLLLNLGVLIELKDNDIEEPLIRWSMVSPNYEDDRFFCFNNEFAKELYSYLETAVRRQRFDSTNLEIENNYYEYSLNEVKKIQNSSLDKVEVIKNLKLYYKEVYGVLSYKLRDLQSFDNLSDLDCLELSQELSFYYFALIENSDSWIDFVINFLDEVFILNYLNWSEDNFLDEDEVNGSINNLISLWRNLLTLENILKSIRYHLNKVMFNDETKQKTPIIQREDFTPFENKSNLSLSALEVAYYAYYMSKCSTSFTENIFPSEKAFNELSVQFQCNWKNIQMSYNSLLTKDVRLKNNRKIKIEKVLPLLPDLAKKIALEEIELI